MSAIQQRANKFPARYFLLTDKTFHDAWDEDEEARKKMVVATEKLAHRLGARGYRFLRTPQGGYAPGLFLFSLPPDPQRWKIASADGGYVPREDTDLGRRLLNHIAEIPGCVFLKVLSVAGIDNIANMAMPPNQVLKLNGRLYLVWYAPAEIPAPFGGAQELSMHEFEHLYFKALTQGEI